LLYGSGSLCVSLIGFLVSGDKIPQIPEKNLKKKETNFEGEGT
jgi:hypothetical protein